MWVDKSSLIMSAIPWGGLFLLIIVITYQVGKNSGFRNGFKQASDLKSVAEIKFLTMLEEKFKTKSKT
jgi:hypothetical protein